ncbi:MAG: HEAT repeat domain-containing protein [Chloroflexi bacterium AL-W]|nr:HEAT repeat domain-containing protein [Chloroflexi bacterium AL-N1]NOK69005.1 HEAT repeat domain-containing protein [Chloroflexi bacterium AL-N10]NOK76988.1 HEAT repeat domain-containing protein [Chloroflexi bacterium AL-N5]NOK82624.1 HEAT repeat domain-containing protein [Chloroflexi bacterium AL-W]NOK90845.1 HEAT repeat domain-containing protein [Chloroflexi bacterium AL-N15]
MAMLTVLQELGSSTGHISTRQLKHLSNLHRAERDKFWSTWQTIQTERRHEIVHAMVEMAEEDVSLNFQEIWLWLLQDTEPKIRIEALEGMWENIQPRALYQTISVLLHDSDTDVRAAAAISLSRFTYLVSLNELDADHSGLRKALMDTILDEQQPQDIRRRAIESIGYLADDSEVQNEIKRAYESGEQFLQESSLVAMGRSMRAEWLPTIERELESQSPALRYEAARAAGEMSEEAQVILAKVLPLVNDSDTEVALSAIWALGQIGGEMALRNLQRIRDTTDAARSQAATDALAEVSLEDGIL